MRVALLLYGDLDTLSGGYLYDRKMVAYLRRSGNEVTTVSLPWRNYAHHLFDNFSSIFRRRLAALQVDVLVQDELCHPSLFLLNRRLRRELSVPLVGIVHHLRCSEPRVAWLNRLYLQVERAYLRTLDGMIFNSRTTRSVVRMVAGAVGPHTVAFPAGDRLKPDIAPSDIHKRAALPVPLRLLFLGNLIPRKGLHVLLEALRCLPTHSWALTVAGSLEMDESYARTQQRIGLESRFNGRVRFVGPLGEGAVARAFRTHHALVVPSLYEGYGIVYIEAMGFGLPAIGTTAGAAGEIITSGRDGFLVPPGNSHALAQRLDELVRDRRRLAGMGEAARKRYLDHPTWDQTGARIRDFLQTVVHLPDNQHRR